MKFIKVFALFFLLHGMAWAGAHFYLSQNKEDVLLVVDTSYSMKPKFPEMGDWIARFDGNSRYQDVTVGTDKAVLGRLSELKSHSVIFRTSFGRMTEASLIQYRGQQAKKKILLSDGSIKPEGWEVITF